MKKYLMFIFIFLLVSCQTITVQELESSGLVYNHKTFVTAIKFNRIVTVEDFIEVGMKVQPTDVDYAYTPEMFNLLNKHLE